MPEGYKRLRLTLWQHTGGRIDPVTRALRVDIQPLDQVQALGPIWQDLFARSDASFFLSWHWMGNWLATLEAMRQPMPELLTVRHGDQVIGLVCIGWRQTTWRRLITRRQAMINTTGDEDLDVVTIEYNDILVDRDWQHQARALVKDALSSDADVLIWRGVEAGAEAALSPPTWLSRRLAETRSFRVDLDRLRFKGQNYLESLSGNTRRQIKRSMALYAERGGLLFERAGDIDSALGYFHEAGQLHQERWRARGKPGAFAYPFYVAMHERLIKSALPTGCAELVRVTCGGKAIAYLFNFVQAGHVYFYLSGIAYESDNRRKPGLIMHALCIQDHLERGHAVYDFMGGVGRYKQSLGQPGPDIVTTISERPHVLVRLEHAARALKTRFIGG